MQPTQPPVAFGSRRLVAADVGTEQMTIRQHLNQQIRRAYPVLGVSLSICIIMGALRYFHIISQSWAILIVAPIVISPICWSLFVLKRGIKCPRCNERLGESVFVIGGLSFCVGKRMRFCPCCGVHLDTELEDTHSNQSA
jgi:hypothetical protein